MTFSWILMNIRSQAQLLRSCQRCRQFLKRMEWLMPAMHRCAAFTYFWHYVLSCSPSALALSFCITKIIWPVLNCIPAISACRHPDVNSKFQWLNKKRHQFLYYLCLMHCMQLKQGFFTPLLFQPQTDGLSSVFDAPSPLCQTQIIIVTSPVSWALQTCCWCWSVA